MRDTMEIDVKKLYYVLRKKFPWIILATLISVAVAYCLTVYVIPSRYVSSVSLYVNNITQNRADVASVNLNDINASQKLVNTYIVILQDDEVLGRVAETLMQTYTHEWLRTILPFSATPTGDALSTDSLRDVLTLSAVNNTEVLRIQAETKHPEVSAKICTLITDVAPAVLQRIVKAGSVEVIGEAKPARTPSSPDLRVNCAIGFALGVVLSALWFVMRDLFDNAIKNEEELKKRFDLPIIGVIPDFTTAKKGG